MCVVNRGMMGVNNLPKTVTRRCCDCDLNPGPSVQSSKLTTQLPSHPKVIVVDKVRKTNTHLTDKTF